MRRRSTPGRGSRWARIARVIVGVAALLTAAVLPALAADDVRVVVSIKPIHSLVAQLMEGVGEPVLLVEGAASPHSFALRPSQVRAVVAAGIFIRVAERLEPFTGRLVRSLPDSVRVVTLLDVPGVRLLRQREHLDFEVHDHDHHDHHSDGASREPSDSHAETDSHIWLDPANAKMIASHIAEVLAERYPQHADSFGANNLRLAERIDVLAKELSAETAPLAGKPFVVFHDAYQYFDRRFDLDAVGSITLNPEVKPSAKRLNELRRKIHELGAICVFAEPHFQPGLVAAVIEGTNAGSGTLDPEGRMLKPGPDLYAELMRDLAANLRGCLLPLAELQNKKGSKNAAP